jgi:medium-chain acyl-CoA synthetase
LETRKPSDHFNFVRDVIHRWAADTPSATALLWTDGSRDIVLSFAELTDRAARVATVLSDAGVHRGDTVIILLNRELRWWEIMLGCIQLGAIPSPGTTQLSTDDIAYRVAAAGARLVIASPVCAPKVEKAGLSKDIARLLIDGVRPGWPAYEAAAEAAAPATSVAETMADEDALCYFTSGTTGYPKMTIHRHDYPLGHCVTGARWLALRPGDLCWNLADTGWAKAAWSSLFAPWLSGAAILAHQTEGFDACAALAILARLPVRTLCAPPTAYRMFLQEDLSRHKFAALRHCVAAGEPLGVNAVERWQAATGLTIRVGYGQTETALICADLEGEPVRPGAMGRPVPGVRLAIVDDDGTELEPGVEGNVALEATPRPAGLFKGYRGDPVRTAATRRDNWYLTGDRAIQDEDGYLWFVGRSDDVILSSGYRIGPFEVESALNSHDAVAESAVVSSPDPTRGEIVKAFVVLATGWMPSDALQSLLKEHVKAATAPYKYPRAITFVAELPKTVSGKILRRQLRDMEWTTANIDPEPGR